MKNLMLMFAVFALLLLCSTLSHACSCATGAPALEYNRAKAVFTGRMLGGTEKISIKNESRKGQIIEAGKVRFAVEEIFKGSVPAEIAIEVASMNGTSCGPYGLTRNKRYVVYAYNSGDNDDDNEKLLYTGVCTRTMEVDSEYAVEDLTFLRNLPPVGTGGNLAGSIWVDTKITEGGAAEPMPNVKIIVRGADNQVFTAVTDKEGEFEIKKLKPGTYRVEPQLPENYFIELEFAEVKIEDRGTAGVGFEAYFTGRVAGRVVDRDGNPFNHIFLKLVSIDGQSKDRRVYGHSTGENGNFDADGVPPGEYILFVEMQHEDYNKHQNYYYPGTFRREDAAPIKIGLGVKIEGLEFFLPDEYKVRTIEGQVIWKNGKPAAGVEVMLLCPRGATKNPLTVEFGPTRTQTDANGRFRLEGLTGESYWLEARGEQSGKKNGESIPYFSMPNKLTLKENLQKVKIALSENGFSGGCGEK